MTNEQRRKIFEEDTEIIDRAVDLAVRLAVEEHRRMGNPIAVRADRKVVWIPPEKIPPFSPGNNDV